MQDALKISSPVSSFIPFVEACCDGVGCVCAKRHAVAYRTNTKSKATCRMKIIRRRIQQNFEEKTRQKIPKENGNHSQIVGKEKTGRMGDH
jgi:hypothetical protein